MDVDLVAVIGAEHIAPLKILLEDKYYFDKEMVSEAVNRKTSFNLIHLETIIKIDVFIFKDEPYQTKVFQRIRKDTLEEGDVNSEFYFSSPEDVILNKLQWYEMGSFAISFRCGRCLYGLVGFPHINF